MRILLSNDDGILAPGLAALHDAIKDLGQVDIVAPDSPQSAAGHAITIHHPLSVKPVHVEGIGAFHGTSVDGRPADCVRLAIRQLLAQAPELVCSGINAGANVGINVFYSGTVAAAAEAAMFGIPAIAFSAAMTGGEVDFRRVARLCRWVADHLLAAGLSAGDLINVNIPDTPGSPRGVRFVPQSTAGIEDVYLRDADDAGRQRYRLGDKFGFAFHEGQTDVTSLADGYITITPLHVDMTDHQRLDNLGHCTWNDMPA